LLCGGGKSVKIPRSFLIWATLIFCGAMVLGAMSWLTRGVLTAEKTRAEAESRADLEERTRLALWRMDAAGAAIVSRENSRSPTDYAMGSPAILTTADGLTKLHFTFREGGELSAAEDAGATEKLAALKVLLAKNPLPSSEWSLLRDAVETSETTWQEVPKAARRENAINLKLRQLKDSQSNRQDEVYQNNFSTSERAQRAKTVAETVSKSADSSLAEAKKTEALSSKLAEVAAEASAEISIEKKEVSEQLTEIGTMRAVWIGQDLFLLRQLTQSLAGKTRKSLQGVWLNHDSLEKRLLVEVTDLFPQAALSIPENAVQDPLALVSFPLHLSRNETPPSVRPTLNTPLIIGWGAVLLALLTVSLLVHGVMKLSERRASFVSAVTHELRTPLTTFRLYSDMLERGAVKPEKRGDYLRVLSREADRLAHLVENVLSFSKIERGSARSVVRESSIAELLEPIRERLDARLASADLSLKMNLTTADTSRLIRVDAAAVEHILFNLIDNSAKYASASDPPEVEIQIHLARRHFEIRVSDHGPGIPVSERRRIFRAFHKSARDAAESRPGVGLGLALSRRLAKSLGGGLDCIDSEKGACFVIRLPLFH
jgi:signal transduction histidine kinase